MSNASKTASKPAVIPTRSANAMAFFVDVEGVGRIPRDIYKYVQSDPRGDLPRYSVHIVIQHFLMLTTFFVLVATGLPIYFNDLSWAPVVISLFGGIETASLIHRIAAFVMMFACAYHVVTIVGGTIRKLLKGTFDLKRTQIPRLKDLQDLIHDLKYFLGREEIRPAMEKFMYKQKLHYLALIYGSLVMMTAGTALLFPDTVAQFFPHSLGATLEGAAAGSQSFSAFFQELARLMHADEAIISLMVLAFWHLTNVHFVPGRFPLQWAFLTGRITREHQIEEHFLEYLNNLREIPQEREYMKNLLKELEIQAPSEPSVSELPSPSEEIEHVETGIDDAH